MGSDLSGIIFLILRIGMAVMLYAFLGWAIFTLWRTLKLQAKMAASSNIPLLGLSLAGETGYQPVQISTSEAFVGRDPACSLYLEDKTISGRHARLYFELSQWWVQDLASTNGTFLNAEQVAAPVALAEGDRLRFGQLEFIVSIAESLSSTLK